MLLSTLFCCGADNSQDFNNILLKTIKNQSDAATVKLVTEALAQHILSHTLLPTSTTNTAALAAHTPASLPALRLSPTPSKLASPAQLTNQTAATGQLYAPIRRPNTRRLHPYQRTTKAVSLLSYRATKREMQRLTARLKKTDGYVEEVINKHNILVHQVKELANRIDDLEKLLYPSPTNTDNTIEAGTPSSLTTEAELQSIIDTTSDFLNGDGNADKL